MNIEGRYKELYTVNIDRIKSFVETLSVDDWNSWNHRQKSFDVHSKTKTYPLGWCEEIDEMHLDVIVKNKFSPIWDILGEEITRLENYLNGRSVSIIFANLLSFGKIPSHIDEKYLRKVHRCHLPIITNDDVTFYVDREPLKLKEGVFYEINNQLPHKVENNSLQDRVHLIIDILPNSSNIQLNLTCE